MTQPIHTPGPWNRNIRCNGKYPIIFSGRNKHVARAIDVGNGEEIEANIDLIATAPELLEALESGVSLPWVHNAAIIDDIEALRRICLAYAEWNNFVALPAIEKARGRNR